MRVKHAIFGVVLLIVNPFLLETLCISILGKCPKYINMEGFNLSQFAGHWYEVERSFYLMEIIVSCTHFNFTLNKRGNLDVQITTKNRISQEISRSKGTAVPMYPGSSILRYKSSTKLPFPVARLLPGAGLYSILKTDYENYAILWSCSNFAFLHSDNIWILGRETDLPEKIRIDVYETLKSLYLDSERLIISHNRNCVETEESEEDDTNATTLSSNI